MPITAPIQILGTDADDTDWTTVAAVKEELGIPAATVTYDALIQTRITRASARLLKFTNLRGVAFRRYEETLPALGYSTRLIVTRTPIVNLLKVEHVNLGLVIDGGDGTEITSEVLVEDEGAGFLIRRFGWGWSALRSGMLGIRLTEMGDPLPNTEEPAYRLDYEAGWVMPSQSLPAPVGPNTPEAFPEDLELAAIKQVAHQMRKSGNEFSGSGGTSGDVKEKKVGDTTIKFSTLADFEGASGVEPAARMFGLSPEAFFLANPWRRAA